MARQNKPLPATPLNLPSMHYKTPRRPAYGDPVLHHYKYGGREFHSTFSAGSFLGIPNLALALLCQIVASGLFVAKGVERGEFLWMLFPVVICSATVPWVFCLVKHFRTVTCNFNGSMLLAHSCAAFAWAVPSAVMLGDGFSGFLVLLVLPLVWMVVLWTGVWGMLRTISMAHPQEGDLHKELENRIGVTLDALL